jgi:pyruvate dehydrogenase E2 component (dihydrolipoamide acetyltransferase)
MIEFRLPSLGADMDEGTLLEWQVKPGDVVKRGQVVAVVDTTKAAIDVECWEEGTVETLIVEPGTKIPVDTVLALLREPGETDEQVAAWKAAHPAHSPATVPAGDTPPTPAAAVVPEIPVAATSERRRVSPAARRHAEERGISLDAVKGTGPGGAITIEDVERVATAGAAESVKPATASVSATAKARAAEMRKTIAAAMARSKREIPHYYLATEVPLDRASRWLADVNTKRPVTDRLLMATLFIKASAKALEKFPELNGFHRDGGFEPSPAVHIGVAISLRQGGLLAPAILDTAAKSLDQIMRELADLTARTRAFSLKSSEMAMPTVTVTNLGDQGVESVFGVIYPPQVAIIGFGKVTDRVIAENGAIRIAPMVTASLAADHRASDGHRGGLFLNELKQQLQAPEKL